MSAHTVTSVLGSMNHNGRLKSTVFNFTGSASYDAGGSVIDLSTSGVLGADGFTSVHGVQIIQSPAASSLREFRYVRVAAATGLLKVHDQSQAADAEAAGSADLSAVTYTAIAFGY